MKDNIYIKILEVCTFLFIVENITLFLFLKCW